jgi:hypothetical protein
MANVETKKPGSADTATVNLSTGNVSFPVHLVSLPGRNGLEFDLSINYSSGGIRQLVDTWTVEAPTGVLGLGWSFPQDKIVRSCNGTTLDSAFFSFLAIRSIRFSKQVWTRTARSMNQNIISSGGYAMCRLASCG